MDSRGTDARSRPATRELTRGLAATQIGVLVAVTAFVVLTAGWYHWRFWPLAMITAFTVISELTSVRVGPTALRVSGSSLGLMLGAVLLGGGPAALIGVLSIVIGWWHSREAPHHFRNNLVTFATYPLLAGLLFAGAIHVTHADPGAVPYYLLVFATFLVGMCANFLAVAGFVCYLDRGSVIQKTRDEFMPLLSAELFSALLAMAAVYLAHRLGLVGLGVVGLMFIVFQYLVGQLLVSKHRSEELRRMAATDDLTGLANRQRFREALAQRIATVGNHGEGFMVILLDLDRFKEINDTLGHHCGDALLRDLGPRLVSAVGSEGLVARLGGDEFGILPAAPGHQDLAIEAVAGRLTSSVSAPFALAGVSFELGASIGVARFPEDGEDSHALLRCADIAMYAAKAAQCDYKIYAAEDNHHSVRRLSVHSDIRRALVADEIVVHYQPIIDLDGLTVRGAEGLVRWQHPEHGLIPPGAFVQTIEQTGLIGPLTRHVLERAIAECADWRRDGREMSVAVNLSVRNLLDRDLPKQIERLLGAYGLPAGSLQLEITESMIMSDPDRALATVSQLSALGVRLSVDDFGTGYSSLANLRRMPIDELKIDRSFVSPMLRDESDLIIVRSTINLGHDLGLRIIAEGVEDAATLQRLAGLGCDLAQGYHISRPMPGQAFRQWLDAGRYGGSLDAAATDLRTWLSPVAPARVA
jgi:diguanylate cyclase (GGDEF)-like protein